MAGNALGALLEGWRPGLTLPPRFYLDPEVFELERARLFGRSWFVVGHASRAASPGDLFVDEPAGAPIVVVRGLDGRLRGFHNTCRHRGARVCERDGRRTLLVCPYHGWRYGLDGSLVQARGMLDGFDLGQHGLRELALRELAGVVLARLEGDDGVVEAVTSHAGETLLWHGLPRARAVHVERYHVRANWKLVVENFDECYHCVAAHPQYCAVMAHATAEASGDPEAARALAAQLEALRDRDAGAGLPFIDRPPRRDSPFWCARLPLRPGLRCQSRDGAPRAPLMQAAAVGAVTSLRIGLFSHVIATADHALLVRFGPVAADQTEVVLTWLVDDQAGECDVEELTWFWRVTTEQDTALVENQQQGLRSPAAGMGPYADAEEFSALFVERYLAMMEAPV